MEWLLEAGTFEQYNHVIVGLMLREIGSTANHALFGKCPEIEDYHLGAEFAWTEYLQRKLLISGFQKGHGIRYALVVSHVTQHG